MSEFYEQRRTSIKDGVALVAFMLGWFAAGPFAWPYITEAFDSGDPAKGVLRFLLVVFAGGVVFGLLGLGIGSGAGLAWEQYHRRRRSPASLIDRDFPEGDAPIAKPRAPREPLPELRYAIVDADASPELAIEYIALLQKAGLPTQDRVRTAIALLESITIGAWHESRLVGVARVLTDSAVTATLADLAVDPAYQRRGLGRILLGRAYDATPRGELSIIAPRGTGPFFEQLGSERALASFVLRHPVPGVSHTDWKLNSSTSP